MNIISYNIHHGVGLDGKLSLKRIANLITESSGTIIGIQEVDKFYSDRSNFEDQAKELATLLNFHYCYEANISLEPTDGNTKDRQYGIAILSKYPIIKSEHILLSSYGKEQRGVLSATIDINGVYITVYNTHLGLDVPSRITQVNELIDITARFQGPKVLLGDFNTEPGSEEIQLLLNNTDFVDSFKNIKNANTFPSIDPNKRIDYIFTSAHIRNANQKVIHSSASDHLPIITKLTITL